MRRVQFAAQSRKGEIKLPGQRYLHWISPLNWSVDLDLIVKRMARPFLWPNCVQKKQQTRYNERQRTGTNGKCLKILGGCNHIKGKDLTFCPDGDS